jgi:hypothetical protein
MHTLVRVISFALLGSPKGMDLQASEPKYEGQANFALGR